MDAGSARTIDATRSSEAAGRLGQASKVIDRRVPRGLLLCSVGSLQARAVCVCALDDQHERGCGAPWEPKERDKLGRQREGMAEQHD